MVDKGGCLNMFNKLNNIFNKSLNTYNQNNKEYQDKKQRNNLSAKLINEKIAIKQVELDEQKKKRQKYFDTIQNR